MDVEVLICTLDRLDLVRECIPKVYDNLVRDKLSFQLTIWDQNSSDPELKIWLKNFSKNDFVKVVFSKQNVGKLQALVKTIQNTPADFILELDPDCIYPFKFSELVSYYNVVASEVDIVFLGWDIDWKKGSYCDLGIERSQTFHWKYELLPVKDSSVLLFGADFEFPVPGCCRLSKVSSVKKVTFPDFRGLYDTDRIITRSVYKGNFRNGIVYSIKGKVIKHLGVLRDSEKYKQFKLDESRRTLVERKRLEVSLKEKGMTANEMNLKPIYHLSVIVAFKGEDVDSFKKCVGSIIEYTDIPFELIIVIDKDSPAVSHLDLISSPGYKKHLAGKKISKLVKVVLTGKLDFGYACSKGVSKARGGYIAIVEGHSLVPPGWAGRLIRDLENNNSRDMIVGLSPDVASSFKISGVVGNRMGIAIDNIIQIQNEAKNKIAISKVTKRIESSCWLFRSLLLFNRDIIFKGWSHIDVLANLITEYDVILSNKTYVHWYGDAEFWRVEERQSPPERKLPRRIKQQKIFGSVSSRVKKDETAGYITEGAVGDALLCIPAIKFLRSGYKNVVVATSNRVLPIFRRLLPAMTIVGESQEVSVNVLYRAAGFLARNKLKGEIAEEEKYKPGMRHHRIHTSVANLVNVGGTSWDLDYTPDYDGFAYPDFLKFPCVVFVNGTYTRVKKLWNLHELNKTIEGLKKKGFYTVSMYWEGTADTKLVNVDKLMINPTVDEMLSVISHADLFISNDTGLGHLRALFKKPQVIAWVGVSSIIEHRHLNPCARVVMGNCPKGWQGNECYVKNFYPSCDDMSCQSILAKDILEEAEALYELYRK